MNSLISELAKIAGNLKLDPVAVFPVDQVPDILAERLRSWLDSGYHGTMQWMCSPKRGHPRLYMPECKSLVLAGLAYTPDYDPRSALDQSDCGVISCYAQGDDYHDLFKKRLRILAERITEHLTCRALVCVDTSPIMEKPLAEVAQIGWIGKHSNLVNRRYGSWLFLGVILTDAPIDRLSAFIKPDGDAPVQGPEDGHRDYCGSCRSCIDACPTGAILPGRKVDARRCISYLTIEYKGEIPIEFRKKMGNRIYGCDDCLAACPWNKFATTPYQATLNPRDELRNPALDWLLTITKADFPNLFRKSPIKRIGWARLMRNILIASGNSGDDHLLDKVSGWTMCDDPMVARTAHWAAGEFNEAQDARIRHPD